MKPPQGKSTPEAHPATSVALVAAGAAIAIGALRYDFGSFDTPGAGFLPFFAGLAIAGFSAITFIQTLRSGWLSLREMWEGSRWQRAAIATACLLLYSAFLKDLGFLIATFLLMTYLFRMLEASSWKATVFAALLTTLGFYLVFQTWLEAQLPRGWLSF
jgi:putative tricarboxylic transport membrane protein